MAGGSGSPSWRWASRACSAVSIPIALSDTRHAHLEAQELLQPGRGPQLQDATSTRRWPACRACSSSAARAACAWTRPPSSRRPASSRSTSACTTATPRTPGRSPTGSSTSTPTSRRPSSGACRRACSEDVPMNPGLIVDERLSQAFPKALIDAKMAWAMKQPKRNLLSGRRYGYDGMLWWNGYDTKRKNGLTLRPVARRLSRRQDAGQGRQRPAAAQHARDGLLRAHHPPAEQVQDQAAHRDHAVPPAGALCVPLRGLGRQGALAARTTSRKLQEPPGLQGAQLPAAQHVRRLRRTGSTTARTSRRATRAGSSATASHTRRAASSCRSRRRRLRPDAESVAERERHRRRSPWWRRRTRRCPRRRAYRPTSSSEPRPGGAAAPRLRGLAPWASGGAALRRRSAS